MTSRTCRSTTSTWSVGFANPRGPTLLLALDAHLAQPEPFAVEDLGPYGKAQPPGHQLDSIHRRKVMRKARSKKKRGPLLAELECRYLASF